MRFPILCIAISFLAMVFGCSYLPEPTSSGLSSTYAKSGVILCSVHDVPLSRKVLYSDPELEKSSATPMDSYSYAAEVNPNSLFHHSYYTSKQKKGKFRIKRVFSYCPSCERQLSHTADAYRNHKLPLF